MESAASAEILSAMCDLMKAAHRGELDREQAYSELYKLEQQLSPGHADALRAKKSPAVKTLETELAAAKRRSESSSRYQSRRAQMQRFVADISRLGALGKEVANDGDGDTGAGAGPGPAAAAVG